MRVHKQPYSSVTASRHTITLVCGKSENYFLVLWGRLCEGERESERGRERMEQHSHKNSHTHANNTHMCIYMYMVSRNLLWCIQIWNVKIYVSCILYMKDMRVVYSHESIFPHWNGGGCCCYYLVHKTNSTILCIYVIRTCRSYINIKFILHIYMYIYISGMHTNTQPDGEDCLTIANKCSMYIIRICILVSEYVHVYFPHLLGYFFFIFIWKESDTHQWSSLIIYSFM